MSTEMNTHEQHRHKGRVKFFNSIKGYGFILPEGKENEVEEEVEVFVHHTAIHNNGGFKSLAEGEQVEYDLVQGPKGMQASNVTGPEGSYVQGDPRTHRQQQYPGSGGYRNNHNNNHNNNNNNGNRGGPYNGGYMVDPYGSGGGPYGYAIPGFQFMNLQQPMYPNGQYGQHSIPPQFQYGYNTNNNNDNNTNNNNNLLPGYPSMMYPPNNYSSPHPQYETTSSISSPNQKDSS